VSYDVYLEIDTGGPHRAAVTDTQSPTYNIGPMLREALGVKMQRGDGSVPCLDGMLASEALPLVRKALDVMAAEPDRFKAMNPPNGWGSYDNAVEFLRWLHDACMDHPKATVRT